MSRRITVLIADDSASVRAALARLLAEDPNIDVVGQAADGVEAVLLAQTLRPDVITMDVLMPRQDGLEATSEIMSKAPSRILIVSSITDRTQTDLSFKAMSAGALEVLAKPNPSSTENPKVWGRRVAEAVRLMAEVPVVRRVRGPARVLVPRSPEARSRPPRIPPAPGSPLDAFAIVASTGGPVALATILGALPAGLPVPIFVAQHMATGFAAGLVRWLSTVTPLSVVTAKSDMVAAPGHVYLPPDAHDLMIDEDGVLQVALSATHASPSGDRLLSSVAAAYGARAGGAVLTGMGSDGARGLLELRKAGGATYAQDEESSVVFGMPRAAFEMGAASELVPIGALSSIIVSRCERRAHVIPSVRWEGGS